MTTLLANRQTRRRAITFAILMAVTLLLMAFSANPYVRELQLGVSFALRPLQGALASTADSVANVVGAITEIDTLRIDNAALRDENDRLTNENARLQEVKRENDQLTALMQLQSGFDHATVAARVIGREPAENRRLVTLDKGTDDGIEDGDVVIVQGGAVAGRVTDVGPNFAKVTLISDSSSTMVGQLQASGATGDIVGETGDVLIMRNIDAAVQIGQDEEVFTAGIELTGGIRSPYPKGLFVGSVVDVSAATNDVVQTAFIAPAANLDSFELALVITDYQGGLPPADQLPVPCGTSGPVPGGEVPCYTPAP
jgi:rod shape-determining protein MreC